MPSDAQKLLLSQDYWFKQHSVKLMLVPELLFLPLLDLKLEEIVVCFQTYKLMDFRVIARNIHIISTIHNLSVFLLYSSIITTPKVFNINADSIRGLF